MKIVPFEVPANAQSPAEKKIHRLLKEEDVTEDWIAAWSVLLAKHDYQRNGEVDFLILSKRGFIVLEVKGGRVSRELNGTWTFTNRHGEENRRRKGPFEQAKGAAYTLLGENGWLQKQLPSDISKQLKNLPFAWGVVMPDIEFTTTSPEWTRNQVIDSKDTLSGKHLGKALTRLLDAEWATMSRLFSEGKGKEPKEIDLEILRKVFVTIRPTFDCVSSLGIKSQHLEQKYLSATQEQYEILDACEPLPGLAAGTTRLLCSGGAGTGKTFIAIEAARRKADSGLSVNIICFSPPLASYIKAQEGMNRDSITITPLSQIEGLPKADHLIVDEGQDLLNHEDLMALDGLVEGGLEKGSWTFFYDANYQVNVLGSFDEKALTEMASYASNTYLLTKNCRNTNQIVSEISDSLSVDMGEKSEIRGTEPEWIWSESSEERAKELEEKINYLLSQDVPAEKITLLTHNDPAEDDTIKSVSGDLRTRFEYLNQNTASSPSRGKISVARTDLFKGLENDYIFVLSLSLGSKTSSTTLRSELYVGMTRAKVGLYLILDSALKSEIETLNDV